MSMTPTRQHLPYEYLREIRNHIQKYLGSVTFSSKIKRISADHPPGPVIGRRNIEVLCDWAAVYFPLLLAEL